MAKVITFTDLDTPQNLAGSAVAGGTLDASTTYYYIVYAVFNNYTAHGHYKYESGRSLMSNEIKSNSITSYLARNTVLGAVTNTNSFTDDGSYAQQQYHIPYWNEGHGILTVSGGTFADPITIEDLYDADVAGGWGIVTKVSGRNYIIKASRITFDTPETYLTFYESILTFYGFFDVASGTNTRVLTFGYKHSTADTTYRGCYVNCQNPAQGGHPFFASSPSQKFYVNVYDTIIYGDNENFGGYGTAYRINYQHFKFNGGCDIRDAQFLKNRYFAVTGANNIVRRIRTQSQNENIWEWYPDSTSEITDVDAQTRGATRAIQNSGSNSWKAKNITINSMGYVSHFSYSGEFSIVDTDLTSLPNKMYWVYDNDSSIKDYKTVNLSVRDEGNVAISGALIVCRDKDNNIVFSETTDANGDIDEQEVLYAIHTSGATGQSGAAGGYVTNTVLYSPFTITISKAGYETYYAKRNISEKITQTVTLKKAVPLLIGTSGQTYLKLDTTNLTNRQLIIDGEVVV